VLFHTVKVQRMTVFYRATLCYEIECGLSNGTITNDREFHGHFSVWNLSNFYTSVYVVLSAICVHMNRKAHVTIVNSTDLSKMKDLSRSQAVTYTVNMVVPLKFCKMELLLLQTTNRKWCMTHPIVVIPMTSSYLQGHSPTACLFKYVFIQLCSSWQDFNWQRVARSLCTVNNTYAVRVVGSMFQRWMVCVRSAASKCNVSSLSINAQFDQTKSIIERTCIDRRNGQSSILNTVQFWHGPVNLCSAC